MTKFAVTGPINMGNPDDFTVSALAEKVLSKIGGPSSIVPLPLAGDDPKQRRPDIGQAKRLLDWEPKISLDQGLDKTIPYFRQMLEGGQSI